jgi:HEAT repeat protein
MSLDELKQLIARVGSSDDKGTAAARLVLIGADAVGPLLEELRGAEPDRVAPLAQTVSRIRVGGALRLLEPLARDPDYRVAPAAIAAIGFSRSSDAFRVLAELLGGATPHRDRVVRALGELGDPRGRELLTAEAVKLVADPQDAAALAAVTLQAREDEDPSSLRSYIAIGVALAKLGDHALAYPIGALSGHDRAEEQDPESYIVRLEATHALRILVGPQVYGHLVAALDDPSQEVQESAMRTMLLLGAKQSVGAWIDLERAHNPLAALAHAMAHELVGEWPAGNELVEQVDDDQLSSWWTERESKFLAGTSYRFGRRAWPPDLFPHLDNLSVVDDLRIISGVDFGLHVDPQLVLDAAPDAVARTAKAWWEAHGRRFDHGCLYKYGHRQDLVRVFD